MAVPARLELGTALSGLTSDPAWVSRYLVAGLVTLVPLVGPIALVGWQRRIYELAREGDEQTLPPVRLGSDISHGLPVFVAMLNLLIPMLGMVLLLVLAAGLVSVIGAAVGDAVGASDVAAVVAGLAMAVGYLLLFVVSIGMNLLVPELQRRGFNGDMMPVLAPGESIQAIRSNPGAYGMVIVGLFVANAVASLGVFACYVGMFFTIPMSMAVIARLVAQWDRVVEERLYGDLSAEG